MRSGSTVLQVPRMPPSLRRHRPVVRQRYGGVQPRGNKRMPATPSSLEVSRGTGPDTARTTLLPIVRGTAIDGRGWSAGDPQNPLRIMGLEVVARDGIEPSTREASVARAGMFCARKPKTEKEFSTGRPNALQTCPLSESGAWKPGNLLARAASNCTSPILTV